MEKRRKEKLTYEVERVEGHRIRKSKEEFLIKWKGFSKSENSWLPSKSCDCDWLIEKFLKKKRRKLNQRNEPTTKQSLVGFRDVRIVGREFLVEIKRGNDYEWQPEISIQKSAIDKFLRTFRSSAPLCGNCNKEVTFIKTDPHRTCSLCSQLVHCKCAFFSKQM